MLSGRFLHQARRLSTIARRKIEDGPSLKDFMKVSGSGSANDVQDLPEIGPFMKSHLELEDQRRSTQNLTKGSVHIQTWGCQQNIGDTEILARILQDNGYSRSDTPEEASVILLNTCAIRENAENKVFERLKQLKKMRKQGGKETQPTIGVLGCMAERLKSKLLEPIDGPGVDLVVGPDAYRDVPRLIQNIQRGDSLTGMNVQLSLDETYADITPLREGGSQHTAFLSIQRGCNNMCSFCIVPHTRGRERSRAVNSIVDEVKYLAEAGYKELTLLGQNVNSYHDAEGESSEKWVQIASKNGAHYRTAEGFNNLFKLREGEGIRFAELLDRVSEAAPEMRFRFTSAHPKDFPEDLLHLVKERHNICKQLHLPAQSGSTKVLAAMRRGYTREAYLNLAELARAVIPGVAISSDFIAGFCGETDEDHADTLSLLEIVKYEQAFLFAYSLRERTHAAYHLKDDVPYEVKNARLQELIRVFRAGSKERCEALVGSIQCVLVEGPGKRNSPAAPEWTGRTDSNIRTSIRPKKVDFTHERDSALNQPDLENLDIRLPSLTQFYNNSQVAEYSPLSAGQFVVVYVVGSGNTTLHAVPLAHTSLQEFANFEPIFDEIKARMRLSIDS